MADPRLKAFIAKRRASRAAKGPSVRQQVINLKKKAARIKAEANKAVKSRQQVFSTAFELQGSKSDQRRRLGAASADTLSRDARKLRSRQLKKLVAKESIPISIRNSFLEHLEKSRNKPTRPFL